MKKVFAILLASVLLRWVEKLMDGADSYELVQVDSLTMPAGTYSHPDRGTPFDERSKEHRGREKQKQGVEDVAQQQVLGRQSGEGVGDEEHCGQHQGAGGKQHHTRKCLFISPGNGPMQDQRRGQEKTKGGQSQQRGQQRRAGRGYKTQRSAKNIEVEPV